MAQLVGGYKIIIRSISNYVNVTDENNTFSKYLPPATPIVKNLNIFFFFFLGVY